ncbi:VOC family protein [Pedobacter aquatilis]|uniref:VOC family protein n=1 Tax=Pedobacter aquatilis TaxID=351343 RepID=UPI00292F36B8|nr:VOC family protein [Pedobacter aquatilis]
MLPIKIHLWFDNQAKEAAAFYTSLLPHSKINFISQIQNTPSGDCDIVDFEIAGQPFMAISAGPHFKFNPSISLFLNFDPSKDDKAADQLDEVWNKLADGGKVLMPLDKYPFSKHYGWVQDRFGLSWQLILSNPQGEDRPVVIPSLLFTGEVAGRALEAIDFYCSVFTDGRRGNIAPRPEDMGEDKKGTLLYGDCYINQTWLAAMDSAHPHGFVFNEAVSFMVPCENQEEINHYSDLLSADPGAEQCGWVKDKFGLSWQISSTLMEEVLKNGTASQIERVTKAYLPMKRFDLKIIADAYSGTEKY